MKALLEALLLFSEFVYIYLLGFVFVKEQSLTFITKQDFFHVIFFNLNMNINKIKLSKNTYTLPLKQAIIFYLYLLNHVLCSKCIEGLWPYHIETRQIP